MVDNLDDREVDACGVRDCHHYVLMGQVRMRVVLQKKACQAVAPPTATLPHRPACMPSQRLCLRGEYRACERCALKAPEHETLVASL